MEEKTLISFINHYTSCPMCDGNIIINTDLSIPSTVDKTEDGLLITVYEDGRDPLELRLNYSKSIESNRPFILSTPYHILRRVLRSIPPDAYDRIQLEIACIDCGKFRYWSNNITMDPINKTMGPVEIRSERAQLEHNGEKLVISNNQKIKECIAYIPGSRNHSNIPYIGTFKGLPLKDPKRLILEIKKQLIIS